MSPEARTIRPMSPEAWSAWAGWATALTALVTVIVAGRYASQQVKVARETRDEQAQPNVVLFTEPNPEVPQVLEIVLKNFGATPAYDVKIIVNSKITSTPNLETGEKLADVQIPDFQFSRPAKSGERYGIPPHRAGVISGNSGTEPGSTASTKPIFKRSLHRQNMRRGLRTPTAKSAVTKPHRCSTSTYVKEQRGWISRQCTI